MAQPIPNPPPGFDALSVDEKINYVESLWERIADQSILSIPDWQRELLQERLEAYRTNPSAGRPWAEIRAALAGSRLGRPTMKCPWKPRNG